MGVEPVVGTGKEVWMVWKIRTISAVVLAVLALVGGGVARGQYSTGNYGPAVATPNIAVITKKTNAQVPLDLEFTNSDGRAVKLRELFNGKPVLLSLVYFSCPQLCGLTQEGLVNGILDGPRELKLGQDYNVIVVSIDPDEKYSTAAEKRKNYLAKSDRPPSQAGFNYLVGNQDNIADLADAVGFGFRRNSEGNDKFSHEAGIFICTPDGRLSQTIRGISFTPDELHYRLREASGGRIGSELLGIALSCGAMRFNEHTGLYEHNKYFWYGTGGVSLTTLVFGIFMFVLWRGEFKKKKQGPGPALHGG